ncbi:MAG: YciY family protein [Symbiopectobacterium sp.]
MPHLNEVIRWRMLRQVKQRQGRWLESPVTHLSAYLLCPLPVTETSESYSAVCGSL